MSAKRHSTSLSPDRDTVYSFDLEGRPLSWYVGGRVFKRSLASAIHGRERRGGRRRRWVVPDDQAAGLFADLLAVAARTPRLPLTDSVRQRLDDILRWTPASLLAERQRFGKAYHPVSILPPDQYLSVVLQATRGCSWNRCTFCSFYQDRSFAARSAPAFAEHVRLVRALLGRGAVLRPRLFLADGNALVLSNERLRPLMNAARESFPGRSFFGFVDVFAGERKTRDDWDELRALGLARVTVGLETGHDPLLAWLNKPGSATEALAFVETLKGAGLAVAVIFMGGVGGRRFADGHLVDSLALAGRLPLGPGDLIYLSPFLEQEGSAYEIAARRDGVEALDEDARGRQLRWLEAGIRRLHPGVTVAPYDIREFVY